MGHRFSGELYLWQDRPDSWVFVDLPPWLADQVEEERTDPARAFGAVKVRVTIGSTTWETSLFPSRERATLLLPVKRAVLRREGLGPGDVAEISVEVVG